MIQQPSTGIKLTTHCALLGKVRSQRAGPNNTETVLKNQKVNRQVSQFTSAPKLAYRERKMPSTSAMEIQPNFKEPVAMGNPTAPFLATNKQLTTSHLTQHVSSPTH